MPVSEAGSMNKWTDLWQRKKTDRVCVDCGVIFQDYAPAKRCMPCRTQHTREKKREYMAKYVAKKKSGEKTQDRVCVDCGVVFSPAKNGCASKRCKACQVKHKKEYEREYRKQKSVQSLSFQPVTRHEAMQRSSHSMERLDLRARAAKEKGVSYGTLVSRETQDDRLFNEI
jgi:hypothetical protein